MEKSLRVFSLFKACIKRLFSAGGRRVKVKVFYACLSWVSFSSFCCLRMADARVAKKMIVNANTPRVTL